MISRFYKQFSRNGSAMAPEQLFEKISNFQNMNILYIIVKHVVWRLRIYNYFREIFKFRDFMNTKKFREICFCSYFREIGIFRESNYIFEISRPRALQMMYNMFIILKFEIFSNSRSGAIAESFRENCS